MIQNFIIWNVRPEIFDLNGFQIRWYGLLFASAFIAGYWVFTKVIAKENLKIEFLDSLLTYVAVGTIAGARLGHCLFYEPAYYFANPIEILFVWHGGLASHGAAIGILLALYLFAKKRKVTFLWILDRVVMTIALSGLFIRLGNLMNSEIYGIETTMPWGFIFIRAGETLAKHPTQIYEAFSYLVIFIILAYLYFKKSNIKEGILSGIFFITLFGVRFFIEFVKEAQVEFESTMALNMGQILSIPFILIGVWLLFRKRVQN
jgi:phosphatidylglycerol---prolipoprotein diacylglyceryl transferase